jgi:hypothetical protein
MRAQKQKTPGFLDPGVFFNNSFYRILLRSPRQRDFNASANPDPSTDAESQATTRHSCICATGLPPPSPGNRHRKATPPSAASQSILTRDPEEFSKVSDVSKAFRLKRTPVRRRTDSAISRTGDCEMNARESTNLPESIVISRGEDRTMERPVRLSMIRNDRARESADCSTKTVSRPPGDWSVQT